MCGGTTLSALGPLTQHESKVSEGRTLDPPHTLSPLPSHTMLHRPYSSFLASAVSAFPAQHSPPYSSPTRLYPAERAAPRHPATVLAEGERRFGRVRAFESE
mgnify:CR=1 FL=1